jgi:hypothetical protein
MMIGIKTATRLFCAHPPPVSDEWVAYTAYMAERLGGDLVYDDAADDLWWQTLPATADNLIVRYLPPLRWQQRVWGDRVAQRLITEAPLSCLLVRRYCWPVHHILLLLSLDAGDEAALKWTARLAPAAAATVTILPLLPPIPVLFSHEICSRAGQVAFLASDTPAAVRVAHALQCCDRARLTTTLVLRPGEPFDQIKAEMAACAYDLVVVAMALGSRRDEYLVGSLVRRLTRPLLVAR